LTTGPIFSYTAGMPSSPAYAFCEPVTASSRSRWHIRLLTEAGRLESGGADTPSLCGRDMAWDLGPADVQSTLSASSPLQHSDYCPACLQAFLSLDAPSL